jgi:DNA-binding response OmpR family regulator
MAERKKALVVDDDEPIRTMLAKVVERQNFDVDTARDGAEAIERLDGSGDYNIVVLDLMMPRVDLKRFTAPVFRVHSKPFDMRRLIADIQHCAA